MTQPFASTEYGDQYTRVTSRTKPGFLERLSETAGGMVVGLGLFALYFYVLFTNEPLHDPNYRVALQAVKLPSRDVPVGGVPGEQVGEGVRAKTVLYYCNCLCH